MPAFIAKLELRQLWVLGGGLLAVVLAALSMYAVAPQLKAYRAAVAAHATLRAADGTEPPLAVLLAAESEQVVELGTRMHREMADVPAHELEAVVIGELQSMSSRHDVELASVRPGRGAEVDTFEELLFEVELSGYYGNLYAWLHDVRTDLGFVVIERYAIERAQDDTSQEPLLRATLTLASYRALGT